MKFKRYYGHIKSRFIILLLIIAIISFFSLMVKFDSVQLILLAWVLPYVVMSMLACFSVLDDIYAIDKNHLSDTILMDGKGISEIYKDTYKKAILWEDISEIKKVYRRNLCPRIFITSISGETIWWYAGDKKAEKYISERHPKLISLFKMD